MTISPYEMSVDVAYSRMLSETFSAAVALRFIYSDITYDYSDETSPGKSFCCGHSTLLEPLLYGAYAGVEHGHRLEHQ